MKERGMLFSKPMVLALLDGSKTQTRRIVKTLPNNRIKVAGVYVHAENAAPFCPYGQPGDQLWVRETFCRDKWAMGYRADGLCGCWGYDGDGNRIFNEHGRLSENANGYVPTHFPHVYGDRWIPSIHMPREASRIDLEITAVRVERLQDISEADAVSEGIERDAKYPTMWKRGPLHGDQNTMRVTGFPKLAFRSIWEGINGYDSWQANPWVWVIEFRAIKL